MNKAPAADRGSREEPQTEGGIGSQKTSGSSRSDPSTALLRRRNGRDQAVFLLLTLIFLLVPISAILSGTRSPLHTTLGIIAVGLIVAFMIPPLTGRWQVGRHGLLPVIGVVAISVIGAFLMARTAESNWIGLFYFASIVASRILPERRALTLIGVAGAISAVGMVVAGVDIGSALVQGLSVSLIGFTVFTIGQLRRTNAQLVQARDEIGRLAVAEERVRIARDLHDLLGHSLSVITLKSELAGRLLPSQPDRAREEIADVERVSREALASVRETISGFRRPTLDSEIAEVQSSLAAAGIALSVERSDVALPPEVDSVLAWAVREGSTNILRHSSSARATIRIGRSGDSATADIEDEGPATDRAAMSSQRRVGAGNGLAGLAERVSAGGGAFEAGPTATGGYRVSIRLPLGTDA